MREEGEDIMKTDILKDISTFTIKFNKPLTKESFEQIVSSIPEGKSDLWGNPIKLGLTKVHVYGVDKQTWKPILLELTDKHLICITTTKKEGSNIIERLICNIQKYIDSLIL